MLCNASPYCVYQKGNQITGYYDECSNIRDLGCYGYTTKTSCEGYNSLSWQYNNKCLERNCSWLPINNETGTGVCVETNHDYDVCALCTAKYSDDLNGIDDGQVQYFNLPYFSPEKAKKFLDMKNKVFDICTVDLCKKWGNCLPVDRNGDGVLSYDETSPENDDLCLNFNQVTCKDLVGSDNEETRRLCLSSYEGDKWSSFYKPGHDFNLDNTDDGPYSTYYPLDVSFDYAGLGVCKLVSYTDGTQVRVECQTDIDDDGNLKDDLDVNPPYSYIPGNTNSMNPVAITVTYYDVGRDGEMCKPTEGVDYHRTTCSGVETIRYCISYVNHQDESCYNYAKAMKCITSGEVYCKNNVDGMCVSSAESCNDYNGVAYTSLDELPISSCYCNPYTSTEGGLNLDSINEINFVMGDAFVYYSAKDYAGNKQPVQGAYFGIDRTPPEITLDTARAGNNLGYIVYEGKIPSQSATPNYPLSNLTIFFNTSEPARCDARLIDYNNEDINMQFIQPTDAEGYADQFTLIYEHPENERNLKDGIYKLMINCSDKMNNEGLLNTFVIVMADKRILGVFPNEMIPINMTHFNFTVHTGMELSCNYYIRNGTGELYTGNTLGLKHILHDFTPSEPEGRTDKYYYTTVDLSDGEYTYSINCTGFGYISHRNPRCSHLKCQMCRTLSIH
jgi:hypothetical protein